MENKNIITKTVKVTIDMDVARMMLDMAGFVKEAKESDDKVFGKVLELIECYGATTKIVEESKDLQELIRITEVIAVCEFLKADEEFVIESFGENEDLTLYIHKDCNYNPDIDKNVWNIVTISTKKDEKWVDDTGDVHVSKLYDTLERIYHYKDFETL